MAEWTNICCAIDFSDASRFAMAEAADLARRFSAKLTLLHAYEPPPPPATGVDVLVTDETFGRLSVDLERAMAAWKAEAERRAGPGVPVRSCVRVGAPATEILLFAREEGMDLVVLATHGRSGLRRVVLGSVAERVVRLAPCPVLVVRRKELAGEALAATDAARSEGEVV